MIPRQYQHDEALILQSPVGQRALAQSVGWSLLEWCKRHHRNSAEMNVVDQLVRTKAENDGLEADIRAHPERYQSASALLGIRQVMREREAELRVKYFWEREAA